MLLLVKHHIEEYVNFLSFHPVPKVTPTKRLYTMLPSEMGATNSQYCCGSEYRLIAFHTKIRIRYDPTGELIPVISFQTFTRIFAPPAKSNIAFTNEELPPPFNSTKQIHTIHHVMNDDHEEPQQAVVPQPAVVLRKQAVAPSVAPQPQQAAVQQQAVVPQPQQAVVPEQAPQPQQAPQPKPSSYKPKSTYSSASSSTSSKLSSFVAQELLELSIMRQEMCPIIYEPFVTGESAVLSCGHRFSRFGLTQSLKTDPNKCPLCKVYAVQTLV